MIGSSPHRNGESTSKKIEIVGNWWNQWSGNTLFLLFNSLCDLDEIDCGIYVNIFFRTRFIFAFHCECRHTTVICARKNEDPPWTIVHDPMNSGKIISASLKSLIGSWTQLIIGEETPRLLRWSPHLHYFWVKSMLGHTLYAYSANHIIHKNSQLFPIHAFNLWIAQP